APCPSERRKSPCLRVPRRGPRNRSGDPGPLGGADGAAGRGSLTCRGPLPRTPWTPMPHPLRALCAVSRTLVPSQPGVLPSLGDALVMELQRAARHPPLVAEAVRAAPWCAVVVLVEGTVPPAELARSLPHLPRG